MTDPSQPMTTLAAILVATIVGVCSVVSCRLLASASVRRASLAAEAVVDTPRRRCRRDTTRSRQLAVVVATVAGVWLFGPLLGLAIVGAVGATRRTKPLIAGRRRQRLVDRALPDAVELFVLTMHAGLTPIQAVHELTMSAPPIVRDGFESVVRRIERGEPFAAAMRALPEHLGTGMVGLADVIARADRDGLPLTPVLESLASEARASRRRADEAAARRLPIKLAFPLVMCTLPSFVLLAIAPAILAALSSLSFSS